MRHIYLIARREYLSYVATIGFWVSLCMIPVFLLLGMAMPLLLDRASPSRNFVVVDVDGRYVEAIERALTSETREQVKAVIEGMTAMGGNPATMAKAREALADGKPLREIGTILGQQGQTALAAIRSNFNLVPAPAQTADALKPWLLGERMIEVDGKPAELSAAILITNDAQGMVLIEQWSSNITERKLRRLVRNAVREQMRMDGFASAGMDIELVRELSSLSPTIRTLSPEKAREQAEVTAQDRLPYMMAVMFAFVLWSVVFSVANMLLTSVIEEKSNKILDSLLCAAPLRSILAGKLFGVAAVSFTLLAGWALAGLVTTSLAGNVTGAETGKLGDILSVAMDPGLLIPFFGYFIFGYLMFGSIYLALGSLCETLQEAQTLMTPMIFLMMMPMMALVFALQDPESPVLAILSWIPLFTPYIMMARLPTDPPLLEIIGTSLVMLLTTGLVLMAAGKVFRAGAMHQAGSDYFKKLLGGLFSRAKPGA